MSNRVYRYRWMGRPWPVHPTLVPVGMRPEALYRWQACNLDRVTATDPPRSYCAVAVGTCVVHGTRWPPIPLGPITDE